MNAAVDEALRSVEALLVSRIRGGTTTGAQRIEDASVLAQIQIAYNLDRLGNCIDGDVFTVFRAEE